MELSLAKNIANTIVYNLKDHCETDRIHIAGSIRREVPEVKDIEIVCQPKTESEADLFGEVSKTYRSAAFIKALSECFKELKVGNIMVGRYAKLIIYDAVLLDLFMPQPADYFRMLAIRTGSKEFSQHVIAAGWLRKGWCGVKDVGLRLQKDCYAKKQGDKTVWELVNKNPTLPPVWQSEKDFFEWLGEPYIEPRWRMGVSKSFQNFEAR